MDFGDINTLVDDTVNLVDPTTLVAAIEALGQDTSNDDSVGTSDSVTVTPDGSSLVDPVSDISADVTGDNLFAIGLNFLNEVTSTDQAPLTQDMTDSIKETATDSNYIDKKRLVEMYVYQEKKYEAYLGIFTQFTFYCVILLILAILKKRFILSNRFTKILIFVLVVVSGIHMYLKIADVNMRNSINFDEYDWSFSTNNQSDPNKIDTNLHEKTKGGASCVEAACCKTDFTEWCATQGLCIQKGGHCSEA